jgi:hypothetical protein
MAAAPSNIDLLAWFDEDEREVCSGCGDRASVSFPESIASFCLGCGAITVDGIRVDREGRIQSPSNLA